MTGEEDTLEYTPTWVVASVCGVIVAISFLVERSLHSLGKCLKRKGNNPLHDALQKIKEELMLLGFISLLLTISGAGINSICISKKLASILLPCSNSKSHHGSKFHPFPFHVSSSRHLLSNAQLPDPITAHCTYKGKVPMLYATALHHLHLFIFVLAFAHVIFCALTIIFGGQKIRKWKRWEDSATSMDINEVTYVENIRKRMGFGSVLGWLHSFFKHFHGSVTKSDYLTLRLGFIKKHCPGNPAFDFHGYMMRHLEADFKKVVGISWYLWIFVVIFFLVNIIAWDTYLFEAFIPFSLLLAVGTKLEHVITELAEEVTQLQHVGNNNVEEGDMVVRPSDEHFWFGKPKFMLVLIHFILFQNSFELAYLFFILLEYHHDSCIIGSKASIIVRVVLGAFVRFVCSYNTLPLYTIVTQMGSSFKKQIFDESIHKRLDGWVEHARVNKGKNISIQRVAATSKSNQIHPLASIPETVDHEPAI